MEKLIGLKDISWKNAINIISGEITISGGMSVFEIMNKRVHLCIL